MKKILIGLLTLGTLSSFANEGRITFKNLSTKLLPPDALKLAEDVFTENCNPNAVYIATGEVIVFQRNNNKRLTVNLHVYGERDTYSNNEEGYRKRSFTLEERYPGQFEMVTYNCESNYGLF